MVVRISEGIVADLPPEVLLYIFSFLDDLTLYAVGNVCRRWNIVLNSQVLPEQWQVTELNKMVLSLAVVWR